MFPFLIGKVLTLKDFEEDAKAWRDEQFPFLIGKVLTHVRSLGFDNIYANCGSFPFLIGKVLT